MIIYGHIVHPSIDSDLSADAFTVVGYIRTTTYSLHSAAQHTTVVMNLLD